MRLRLVSLVLLAIVLVAACSKPATHWNVLVIVMDTVRADHLAVNGYARPTSPHLARLAKEGANFSQAITTAPRTWQSFATILTGLYPPHHGVRYIHDYPLEKTTPTLATALGKAGYATHSFDRVEFIRKITGGFGFDAYYDPIVNTDRGVLEQAWIWMQSTREQPFFAFVRLNAAHWPYTDDPGAVGFGSCEGQDHAFNARSLKEMGVVPSRTAGEGLKLVDAAKYKDFIFTVSPDAKVREHIVAHYDAEVLRTDADVGWLLDEMRAAGVLDRTVVVITADHGESFGEHGYNFHGPRVDDPVMRVPLIIRLPPGDGAAKPGTVVDQQVRTVDILPTVLSAVGVPLPERLDGISLLPALRGEAIERRWAYAESERDHLGVDPDYHVEGVKGTHRMARTEDWKLVYVPRPDGPELRLYDLRGDAGETRNVAAEHPDQVAQLRALLDTVLAGDADLGATKERVLTDAEKEQLRQLGYE